MPVETGAGDDSIGAFIEHHIDKREFPGVDSARIFAPREQEILFETPIEECADAGSLRHDSEGRKLTDHRERRLRRCDQPVL